MCMGGGSEPDYDYTNQNRAAALARQQEEDWIKRFQPWEQELAGDVLNQNDKIAQQVKDARNDSLKSFEASKATADRNLARYGGQMDADQKEASLKSQNLKRQGVQIGAMGAASTGGIQRYDKLAQSMVNVGRGVQAQGLSGIKQGVGLEGQRNQQAAQMAAQENASRNQMIGTVVGAGAMLAMPYAAPLMMSDKHTKKNVRKASTKKALKDVESVALKKWDYKPGMSAGREEKGHIGGMAQDMPDSMTTKDKKRVDVGDSVMTLVGATQELSKRIGMLEKGHVRTSR